MLGLEEWLLIGYFTAQLMLGANNPRDVAYIFRDYMRKIHAKARANDPNFIKIAVLAGRVRFLPLPSPSDLPSCGPPARQRHPAPCTG